ncbi:hypothetical protein [Mucilaginibacter sp. KACC 22063]|uniref:hypothetical protein n=1 Tax=Mucilaginibacter sp. KACC 22063 TaxID=3025666 RepID=UPI002366A72A|nr:hypothetical protein [Mucilaginibacter sp. KACC 22063]WDF56741.1 hypothetical protein PQ461_06705 [Mucilaginibacter sp. KACC 22063]
MKKYLITIVFFLTISKVEAQHINFPDMLSLVGAPTEQVVQFLTVGKRFQFVSSDMSMGYPINKYQNRWGDDGFRETIITGMGSVIEGGRKLHVLSYTTTSLAHINELIVQIRKYGYPLTFKGHDDTKNIRIYESDLYSVTVYLPFGKGGYYSVEVHEKQAVPLDY